MAVTAPTGEVGDALVPWSAWSHDGVDEEVPALQWPNGLNVFHRMRTDPQIDALTKSVVLPLSRLKFRLDPNGARDEVVAQLSEDLGLSILGEEDKLRSRRRFKHAEHFKHALLALWYGHMFFEQVGEIDDNGDWHLRKLPPRMPRTIAKIHVAKDGGLDGITQHGWRPAPRPRGGGIGGSRVTTTNSQLAGAISRAGGGIGFAQDEPQVGIERLIAYVWEKEGANWTGRSMLRPLYQPWLLKDRALRVDAIKNERFGAGIPTGRAPGGGDPAEYQRMAAAIRATETGGVGLPQGGDIGVEGVRGSLPDVLASIRYYDELMARSFLAMFMQLGQTQTGSRALGDTFSDFFQSSIESIAHWYVEVTNEHLLTDIVDWNFGEDEEVPLLIWEYPEEEPPGIDDLKTLIDAGLLAVDPEVEDWVRDRYNLPARPEEPEPPVVPTPPVAPAPVEPPVDEAPVPPVAAGGDARPKGSLESRSSRESSEDVAAHGNHNQKDHAGKTAGRSAVVAGFEPWAETVTNDELAAVQTYQSDGFAPINGALRSGDAVPAEYADATTHLDNLVARGTVESDVTAYRFLPSDAIPTTPGSEFVDNGFVSTSLSPDLGEFLVQSGNDSTTLVRINVPKGTSAAYLEAVSPQSLAGMFSQDELLLPRGSRMRVSEGPRVENGRTYVDVDLI